MMDRPISVIVLEHALEVKRTQIRALESEAAELERAIGKLQGGGASEKAQEPANFIDRELPATPVVDQEKAVEDDEEYPAIKFKGMSRIQIAVVLARGFDGYLTTGAFRKVLSKPGVLKSTRQVASVASRVLKFSDKFIRISEGLYRLKD